MPTYRMLIEYDGTDFAGWQVQPEAPTVQAALEAALQTALRAPVRVTGSGRTDTGVHARGQVAHFATAQPVDPRRLLASLNGLLPPTVAVLRLAEAAPAFHARYDACARRYHYYVSTAPRALDRAWRWLLRPAPDFDRMNEAAQALCGTHHFGAFCRTASATENRVCAVQEACWVREERPGDAYFRVVADRFLHGMVRAFVGTLVEVGRGRRPVADVARILATRDRRAAGPAAPPHGLVLEAVSYP